MGYLGIYFVEWPGESEKDTGTYKYQELHPTGNTLRD